MTTTTKTDPALVSHLLRRAGFGSDITEINHYTSQSYERLVEDLLNSEKFPDVDDNAIGRYYPSLAACKDDLGPWVTRWFYRMINTKRPLQEKMALFWHHVLATAWFKSEHSPSMIDHIQMLTTNGLANFRTILLELSRDPAMIYWLDNNENHAKSINENYGREILELFSMGIGNYSEDDIKSAARSFTGWSFKQPLPLYPFGHYDSGFRFISEDHDYGEKTFLGHKGNFNGEDIINIIASQEATAKFVCRHLYNFFVEDEPQVPAWSITPPKNQAAIDSLVKSWFESDADIRSVMRTLFNAEWFKNSLQKRVKCPAEFIVGTLKISGDFKYPEPGLKDLDGTCIAMGQALMNPPSVEGWHTGKEWIDGGTLTERVNFAVKMLNDPKKPGVRNIISIIKENGKTVPPEMFVSKMLEALGYLKVSDNTHSLLTDFAEKDGHLKFGTEKESQKSEIRIVRMLRLIVSSMEFQFA
ncbi:MAG: DUF1800 domain-containing protein [Dehalococcoidia bacterium]|jgi:uncharacterized protein (DUF1800 family)|nr:hypothetical protein [Chloroflexota bacterium]MDP7231710.1 DUF1800 domain-containing protein [Dehalococcoidia bacterium]MDP7613590.1 DUF1800 domain-containing protein [Dehalococcoidia bacterium]|tara:strand:- start:653 stop:2068 length:1416 start_codon:yes stop_codon:yes gene_type:complete